MVLPTLVDPFIINVTSAFYDLSLVHGKAYFKLILKCF